MNPGRLGPWANKRISNRENKAWLPEFSPSLPMHLSEPPPNQKLHFSMHISTIFKCQNYVKK